jgi:hypothetical protein
LKSTRRNTSNTRRMRTGTTPSTTTTTTTNGPQHPRGDDRMCVQQDHHRPRHKGEHGPPLHRAQFRSRQQTRPHGGCPLTPRTPRAATGRSSSKSGATNTRSWKEYMPCGAERVADLLFGPA